MAESTPAPGAQPEQTPAAAGGRTGYRGPRRFLLLVIALIVLVGVGIVYYRSTLTEDTDDAQINGHLIQVSSRIGGQVLKVNVAENQLVSKGTVIAELDPRDYQVARDNAAAALASAEAALAAAEVNVPITVASTGSTLTSAQADVSGTQSGIVQAERQLESAKARVAEAAANNTKAQADLERYRPLVAKDVISKQQFDAATAAADSAKAALAEAQASQAAAEQGVKISRDRQSQAQASYKSAQTAPQQVAAQNARAMQAKAQVAAAKAQLDQANLNLSYTQIVAPTDGIVTRKSLEVDQNISVGQNLLTLVSLDDLWVTANFKETQLKSIHPGQSVEIAVDATGKKYAGKVTQVGGATGSVLSLFPPENATGNYVKVVQRVPVRIDFTALATEDKDHQLRPGLSVEPAVSLK